MPALAAASMATLSCFYARGQVLFSENFNDGSAASRWTAHSQSDNGTSDYFADFGFDYSSLGIPAAPDGSGTVGVKLDADIHGLAGAEGVNINPLGKSFSGDYLLRFNLWARVAGDSNDSTEDSLAGINAGGSNTNWFSIGGSGSDGQFFSVTGDGGAGSFDYTQYLGNSAGDPSTTPLFANTDALPKATFPAAGGTPQNQWVRVEISQINNVITWKLNGVVFDTWTNASTFTTGNIFLGHQDLLDTDTPNTDTFSIFDNVNVLGVSRWLTDGDGNWNSGNWSAAAPSTADAVAYLGPAISQPRTIALSGSQVVGDVIFDSPVSYTLTGGVLTLAATSSQATLDDTRGNHTIASSVLFTTNTFISISNAADTLNITGDQTAAANVTLTKAGLGTLQMKQINAATLSVQSGVVRISSKSLPNDPAGVTIVQNLRVASGSSLDLTNNSMIIDYSGNTPVSYVRTALQSGRIFTSSGSTSIRLGFADNSSLGLTSFAGQTIDLTSVLIKYTFAGDANLDGKVDVSDLGALASNWQKSGTWLSGDFNYDGKIDVSDLGLLATNWQAGVGSPLTMNFQQALAQTGLSSIDVPEPSLIFSLAALLCISRPKRRRLVS